jgi:hypothetical protein
MWFEDSGYWRVLWERKVGSRMVEPSIGDGMAGVDVWNRESSDEELSGFAVSYAENSWMEHRAM